jgi:Ca2+-binding EF-hand superfamily protein
MRKFVSGGVVLAALFAVATAQPTFAAKSRTSFFNMSQNRSDVPAHVERMFKGLDLNHDGFVSKDEIAALKSKFDDRMSKNAPKRIERMFDRMDSDHDGKVTQAEIDAARAARLAASGKTAKAGRRSGSSLFVRADANNDGTVTRAEFEAAAASGKIKLRQPNMRGNSIVRLFDAADTDKDGRLSLDEARQAALQHFDAADADHNGVLTPDERRHFGRSQPAKRQAS